MDSNLLSEQISHYWYIGTNNEEGCQRLYSKDPVHGMLNPRLQCNSGVQGGQGDGDS